MTSEPNKIKNFISIVVYVKNSENYIKNFIKEIDNFMKDNFVMYEFIIVNNFSNDNTTKFIKDIKYTIKGKVTIINLAWEHSKDACMMAGCNIAIGDFILQFEVPFIDYNIYEILNIYNVSLEGYDVVSASPKNKIKFREKIFYQLLKHGSKMKMEFTNERFRIISRRAVNRIYKNNNLYTYRKVAYHYSGFDSKMYFYYPINKENYKEKESKFKNLVTANNILSRYTNFYFLLPLLYILVILICPFIPNKVIVLIGSGLFMILLSLCLLIRYIKSMCKKDDNENSYVYKSIERL